MSGNTVFAFDGYRIDPAKRELWHEGELLALQPKAFDCLVYLLEHRDRVVGRDELIATVWGKVDIADSVLGQIISRIRSVLGDSAAQQSAIRTITRVGYSWVMPVHLIDAESEPATTEPGKISPVLPTPSSDVLPAISADNAATDKPVALSPPTAALLSNRANRRLSRPLWMGLVLAITLLPAVIWWSPSTRQPAGAAIQLTAADNTTIVLPVRAPPESENAWVRLGVMDLIGERLRTAGQAVVPSDNVVALARDLAINASDAEVAELARAASAHLVLRSQAEPIGTGWRVSITALHEHDRPLQTYGDGENVIDAARAATDRLAMLLNLEVTPADEVSSGQASIDHLLQQVRAAILVDRLDEARSLLGKADIDDIHIASQLADVELRAGNYVEAESLFAKLVEQVPESHDPILRAQLLHGLAFSRIRQIRYDDAWAPVDEAITLLSSLSPLRASHGPLGSAISLRAVLHRVKQDYSAAEADYTRARVLFESSGDQMALAKLDNNLASLLMVAGRVAEADTMAQRALEQLRLFGDVQAELRLRTTLLELYRHQLDTPRAQEQVDEFERLFAQIDNPDLEEFANLLKVDVLVDVGLLHDASALTQQLVEEGATRPRNVIKGIWPEYAAAWVAHDSGDPGRAAQYAWAGLSEHAQAPTSTAGNIARTWRVLYLAHVALGDDRAADATFAQAMAWAAGLTNEHARSDHWLAILQAEHAARQGDQAQARRYFEQAWDQATRRTTPLEILEVARPYGDFLFAQGDLQQATLIAGRAAAWTRTSFHAALLQTRLHHALGQTSAWRRALDRSQAMAGDRAIPESLLSPPTGLTGLTE